MAPRTPRAAQLREQLDWHWTNHLRRRFDGLTDDEYFWEPVAGCWSVRHEGEGSASAQLGTGGFRWDWTKDEEPDPPPVTTIAWRLGHLIVGVFGGRAHRHFGAPAVDPWSFPYAGSAAEALSQLDEAYASWDAGVAALDDEGMDRPVGRAEPAYPDSAMSELVLHINRETIHHGAEIALLRDLYRAGVHSR